MGKKWMGAGAFLMAAAIVLGALGAHALEKQISANLLESYKTGVAYHLFHALALIVVGLLNRIENGTKYSLSGWLFALGIFCFSGSIYVLSTREISGWEVSFLGPVTPLGGLLFIAGWIVLGIKALRNQ
jgi:uncharacterized membrane protein YgdD (TMEM256/DUF423 family)